MADPKKPLALIRTGDMYQVQARPAMPSPSEMLADIAVRAGRVTITFEHTLEGSQFVAFVYGKNSHISMEGSTVKSVIVKLWRALGGNRR